MNILTVLVWYDCESLAAQLAVHAFDREYLGPPDAGNPHVRWEEERGDALHMACDY